MTIRAVLFDFDMTLIDTSGALLANVNKIADHFGRPRCTRERLLEVIGYNSRDFWRALLGDERPEYGEYYVEECAPYEAAMMTPAAGAVECVAELRALGVKVGCASNRIAPLRVIRVKHLEHLMDCVVGADAVARPKPAPDVLLRGAELLGCAPAEALYVGDTPIDVEAAHRAGMRSVAVLASNSAETLNRAGAWRIVADLRGFVPLLKGEGLL